MHHQQHFWLQTESWLVHLTMGRMGVSVGRLKCCTGYFIMIFLICSSWKNIRIQCYSPINPHLPKDQSDSWPGRGAWSQHVELPTGQITPSSLLYLQTLQVWFHCWWWQSHEPFGHLYLPQLVASIYRPFWVIFLFASTNQDQSSIKLRLISTRHYNGDRLGQT